MMTGGGRQQPRGRWRRLWQTLAGTVQRYGGGLAVTTAAGGVLLICAIWAAIAIQIDADRTEAIHHAEIEAANLSAAFQEEISQTLEFVSRQMDLVADRMRATPEHYDINDWASDLRIASGAAFQRAIVAPDGKVMSSTLVRNAEPMDLRDRKHIRIQLDGHFKGIFVSKPVIGRVSGRLSLNLSRRVEAQDGTLLGIIVFSLAPEQLTRLHERINFGSGGMLALIGATDRVIRAQFGPHATSAAIGRQISSKVPLPTDGTNITINLGHGVIDHQPRLYAARLLPGYDLVVSVGLSMDEILAPGRMRARQLVAAGVISSVMLCSVIALLLIGFRQRNARELKLRASEERLRDFAELSSDWFWEQDAELRFTNIGTGTPVLPPGDTSHYGRTRWEMNGCGAAPEVWEKHRRTCLNHQPFRDFRYTRLSYNGRLAHLSVSGMPVFDESGAFAGYRGTGRDVTAQIEAENELRAAKARAEQAEALLRDAVDSISEGFVIYDREDRFVLCNESYRKKYPQSAGQMIAGNTFEQIARYGLLAGDFPDAIGRENECLQDRMQRHRAAEGELEQRLTNGRWTLVTERRMRNGGIAGLRIDITALKQAQLALRESEARLDRAQQIAAIGSWELDIASGRCHWSREMYRLRGIPPDSFQPTRAGLEECLHPNDRAFALEWLTDLEHGIQRKAIELRVQHTDGERIVSVEGRPIARKDGQICKLIGTMQDITERRLTEKKLVHAQKMETIGQLTGGMAHDFNNLLGVILGNLDLLAPLVAEDPLAEELRGEAHDAARRGADLTRRLLAFARRQPLRPINIDANALVDGLAKLLMRILGPNIVLSLDLDEQLCPVAVDPGELESALTNLATNARDAMPLGGRLTIATRNASIDRASAARYPELSPGDYVVIEVNDTGTGIPCEIVGRIFEPFFTTKKAGKGSGLGLSMVFGFIKQSGGHVTVHSEPSMGSAFRLYLPRSLQRAVDRPASDHDRFAGPGGATVLVVEDNAQLRRATARALLALGYDVLEAEDADAALEILGTPTGIDLLFTDIVMPGEMNGLELAARATALRPDLRVLLTSGFPDLGGAAGTLSTSHHRLLTKPYSHDALVRTLREIMDAGHTALAA